MDTNMKDIKLGITLSPVYWDELPEFSVAFNDIELEKGFLDCTKQFNWTLPCTDNNVLTVNFLNKKDGDSVNGKDKALVIDQIEIEGFKFYSFLMAGKYTPVYPEGYYEYAKQHGLSTEPVLTQTYLSFNGQWQLNITWPVFSWIHQTENLGWLYDKNI